MSAKISHHPKKILPFQTETGDGTHLENYNTE